MGSYRKNLYSILILFAASWLFPRPLSAEITLVAQSAIVADDSDASGLTGFLEDGTPENRLGAFGSAICYTGREQRYIALPDRGPADGTTNYLTRFHEFNISLANGKVDIWLLRTQFLTNEAGSAYTGLSSAFDATNPARNLRLDPEGARLGFKRTLFVADEYGPSIHEFDLMRGKKLRSFQIPPEFLITTPNASSDAELPPANTSGRQSNRGLEGLAISPDGNTLFGIMQSPLLQDHALDAENKRAGLNVRILELSLATGETKQYLYPLEDKKNGANEILAVNDHEFLVLERDGKAGSKAEFKKIYKIDISWATDISSVASLPQDTIPSGITPVSKTIFIDLLNPAYGIAGRDCPEKFEGLAFGPDFSDGRHLLLVTTDNDFDAKEYTKIYAFAIDPAELPEFQSQQFYSSWDILQLLLALLALGLGFKLYKKIPRRTQPATRIK